VDAIDALHGKTSEKTIRNIIGELTFRNTYGAFSELVAYKWLNDAKIDFTPQVLMTASDVLNPNGSIIDGQMILAKNKPVSFDIKGFGFHAHKIKILQQRLQEAFNGKSVLIEGTWDVSIEALQELLDYDGFSKLVEDLQSAAVVRRGRLEFRTQDRRPVTVSSHSSDPLVLANENKTYPLRFAGQYTRNGPFMLVFVIHPWFSQGELHQNFAGFVDTFTKELAKLAFLSFRNDSTLVEGVQTSDVAKLLSGLVFLNGWPADGTDAQRPRPFCRIYLNPIAAHPLTRSDFSSIEDTFGHDVVVDEIADDVPAGRDARPRRLGRILVGALVVLAVVGIIFRILQNDLLKRHLRTLQLKRACHMIDPESLYIQLGHLLASVPDFAAPGPLSDDTKQWLARAYALVRAAGDKDDACEMKKMTENFNELIFSPNSGRTNANNSPQDCRRGRA
jgi:hypothetical protein